MTNHIDLSHLVKNLNSVTMTQGQGNSTCQCWISPAVTFWSTFSLCKYVQGKSSLSESVLDCQVFKIKTVESEYRTQGTSLRQG